MFLRVVCTRECKKILVSFVWLSPLCGPKCLLKSLASKDEKSHWLHLFDFSPLCVFKCLLILLARENAESHWLHLFDFFHCASSSVSSNCLSQRMDWLHSLDFFPSFLFVIGTFSSTLFSLNWFISKFDLSPSNNWCFFWYGWLLTGKYSRLYIVLE